MGAATPTTNTKKENTAKTASASNVTSIFGLRQLAVGKTVAVVVVVVVVSSPVVVVLISGGYKIICTSDYHGFLAKSEHKMAKTKWIKVTKFITSILYLIFSNKIL